MCHKLPWLSTTAPRQGHDTGTTRARHSRERVRHGQSTGRTRAGHGHNTAGRGQGTGTTQQDEGRARAQHSKTRGRARARHSRTRAGHTAGAGAGHTAGAGAPTHSRGQGHDTQQAPTHSRGRSRGHTAGAGAGTHSRGRGRDTQQCRSTDTQVRQSHQEGPNLQCLAVRDNTVRGRQSPASCFVAVTARTMARAGGHRDPTPRRGVTGTSCGDLLADKFRELCFSGKRGHQCKKQGPPTLMSPELPCTVARTSRASTTKVMTQSKFAQPSSALAPLLPCPCCLTWMACLIAGTFGRAPGWDSPSKGKLRALLLCCLERSRFPVPCDECWSFGGRPVDVWWSDSPSNCPLPQTRASRRSERVSRPDVRIRRFCPRRGLLWPSRWPMAGFGDDHNREEERYSSAWRYSLLDSSGRIVRSSRISVLYAALVCRMCCIGAMPPSRGSPLPPDPPPWISVYFPDSGHPIFRALRERRITKQRREKEVFSFQR